MSDPDIYRRLERIEKILEQFVSNEVDTGSSGYPALSGLTTGQPLRATGATAAAFGPLDLANADAITGDLPDANLSANVPLLDTANTFTAAQAIEPTTGAPLSLTAPAAASSAETLLTGTVADDTGSYFQIFNVTTTDASFIPGFRFRQSAALIAGFFLAEATTDTGSNPVMVIDSRNAAGSAITTRRLFELRTFGNFRFGVSPAGALQILDGITAPATAAGIAQIYVDSADGDLKIKFGDGTTKTIVTDT